MPTKFSEFTDATSLDYEVGLSGGANAKVRPPKKYVALLTQAGTDAPTAIVLENTLGGTVVWSYVAVGQYTATLAGAFPADKTVILMTTNVGYHYIVLGAQTSLGDTVDIIATRSSTEAQTDSVLAGTPIEIRVYY